MCTYWWWIVPKVGLNVPKIDGNASNMLRLWPLETTRFAYLFAVMHAS